MTQTRPKQGACLGISPSEACSVLLLREHWETSPEVSVIIKRVVQFLFGMVAVGLVATRSWLNDCFYRWPSLIFKFRPCKCQCEGLFVPYIRTVMSWWLVYLISAKHSRSLTSSEKYTCPRQSKVTWGLTLGWIRAKWWNDKIEWEYFAVDDLL